MLNFQINKNLLPMKGHYFLWNAGTAPVVPFMSIFARQLGFSSVTVGIIYTVLPFSGMLAKPIMGAIADRYKCQKLIFLAAQLVAAAAFFTMIFLPELPSKSRKIHFACDYSEVAMNSCGGGHSNDFLNDSVIIEKLINEVGENASVSCRLNCPLDPLQRSIICKNWAEDSYCDLNSDKVIFDALVPIKLTDKEGPCVYFRINNVTLEKGQPKTPLCPNRNDRLSLICDVNCDSYAVNEIVEKSSVEDGEVQNYHEFWFLLGVFLIAWIGQAVTVSVGDAICFQLLGDKPHKYGYQRMWGAMGWGVFSIIAGALVDVFSKGEINKNYSPVFGIAVGILLLCVIVSYQIQYNQQHMSASILRDVGRLLANLRIFVFMLWCISVGLCTALMWNFLFWLLEDLAKAQGNDIMSWIKTIEGLVMGIQCLGGELPFFFLSGFILKRIGHVNAMSLVLLVVGVRFIFYSLITNPWWFLPIEFLNGLTFGLFYATMASYASIVSPPGTETTTQGLVGAVFEGVGVSLGSFLGGILYEDYGGPMTFRIFGVSALVVCLVHAGTQFLLQRYHKTEKEDSMAQYASPQKAISLVDDDQQELRLVI